MRLGGNNVSRKKGTAVTIGLTLLSVFAVVATCNAQLANDPGIPPHVQPITRQTRAVPVEPYVPPVEPTPVQEEPTDVPEEPLPDVDVDVHHDDHNGRDGGLTFGYCARHWWC